MQIKTPKPSFLRWANGTQILLSDEQKLVTSHSVHEDVGKQVLPFIPRKSENWPNPWEIKWAILNKTTYGITSWFSNPISRTLPWWQLQQWKIRTHNVIHCSLVFNCKNWKQPNAQAQESHWKYYVRVIQQSTMQSYKRTRMLSVNWVWPTVIFTFYHPN